MTYLEICKAVSDKIGVPESQARKVMDAVVNVMMDAMADGDDVRIRGLGTFYPVKYKVTSRVLEFGRSTTTGERYRVRYRPAGGTNERLTRDSKSCETEC